MTATPKNPFVPHIPIPHTGEMYTDFHQHIDVDALFDQYDESDQLKPVVQQAIRSLEQNLRGYDADMKGSERGHKVDQAQIASQANELNAMERRIKGLEEELTKVQSVLLEEREVNRMWQQRYDLAEEEQSVTYHDLVAMTTQCNDYREKVEELSHESKQLQADNTTLLADNEEMAEQLEEQDYTQLNDQYTVLEARNDKLEDENELLQGYLDLNNHLALIERMNESLDVITDRFSTKHQVKHAKMVVDYLRTLWSL